MRIVFKAERMTFEGQSVSELVLQMMAFSKDRDCTMQEFMSAVAERVGQAHKTFVRSDRPAHFVRDMEAVAKSKPVRGLL